MNWTASQQQIFPIAFSIIFIVALVIGFLLKDKSYKIKTIPFLIITIIILVAEVVKQVRAFNTGYVLWSIPLHFCSTFLIWFSIASFGKNKLSKIGFKIALVAGIPLLISLLINPTSIITTATDNLTISWINFENLHTFYYHFTVLLFLALQITLKMPFPTLKDLKIVAIPFFSWMVTASIVANLINVNFSNLLYNNIPFMDSIRLNFGYPVYLISMFLTFFLLCLCILSFGTLIQIVNKGIILKKSKKRS